MNFKIVTLLFLNAVFGQTIDDVGDEDTRYSDGVEPDYSYRQTSTTKGFISAPGCPESEDGFPWVLYGKADPRCFLVGKSFPCPSPAKLHIQLGSPFGECKFDPNDCRPEDGLLRPPRPQHSRFSYCIPKGMTLCHELVHDNVQNKVHELHRKLDEDGVPLPLHTCSPHPHDIYPVAPYHLAPYPAPAAPHYHPEGPILGSAAPVLNANECHKDEDYDRHNLRCNKRHHTTTIT